MADFTSNALTVLNRRYLHDGETPDEMLWRVARHVAEGERGWATDGQQAVDEWAERFFSELLNTLEFLPNSPTFTGAGSPLGQLSACFVLPVGDSIGDIFTAVRDTALIHQSGGGTGFAFSDLRAEGSIVRSTHGVSSGPVSFMRVFDVATQVVKQGGTRRGANMGILRADHPDILEFIRCKADMTSFQNFNISVAATDAFMESVINNDDYPLIDSKGHVTKYASARQVFDTILEEAHRNGDPGLFFIDRANRDNPVPHLGSYKATNPCWAGDTLIATVDGPRPIEELVGTTPLVLSYDPESRRSVVRRASCVWQTSERAKTLKVVLDSGTVLRLTPNHNLFVFKGCHGVTKMRADELEVGMSVKAYALSDDPREPGRVRMHNADGNHSWLAREIYEAQNGPISEGFVVHHDDHNRGNNDPVNLVLITNYEHQSHHYPERLASGFTTEGRTCKELLTGRYNHKVVAIETGDEIPVFNMTVEGTHTYVVCDPEAKANTILSGIVSANCGEEPLLPYESCTLGSIDVSKFVHSGRVDWGRLRRVVHLAMRFLDDVVEVNRFPVEGLMFMNRATRKVGLGIMGFADLLFKMEVAYGSAAGRSLANEVMGFVRLEADVASAEIARSRGVYPASTGSSLRNSTTTTAAPTGTLSILANCTGGIEPAFALAFKRRHRLEQGNVLGVTEMVETSAAFATALGERLPQDEVALILTGVADGQTLREALASNALHLPEHVIDVWRTAGELTPKEHVEMQAVFQDNIDAGVSKTINLSNDATEADIEKAYLMAWGLGCKGITTYRDGSRTDQVLATK